MSSEHQRAAPKGRIMNAISTLAARPMARRDSSRNETRQRVASNRCNDAETGTGFNIVSEAVDLQAGSRVLDVAAGAAITGPTATRRFVKSTSTGYLSTSPEGAKFRADGERLPSDLRRAVSTASRYENWRRRSEKWRRLMVAAQGGQSQAYEQLLRPARLGKIFRGHRRYGRWPLEPPRLP
jgi:hypothetical protein